MRRLQLGVVVALGFGCGEKKEEGAVAPQVASAAAAVKPTPATTTHVAVELRAIPNNLGPLPAAPIPASNAQSASKVELGRMLYWEPRLSGDGSMSCATCHNPALGWSDGRGVAQGFKGKQLARAAPTVLNAAHYTSQFWDGRAASLEEQAKGPITAADEMNGDPEAVVKLLTSIEGYNRRFVDAFGGPPTFERALQAIAAFERTVVDQDSPFDRYARGDDKAISDDAKKGLEVFVKTGRCSLCHQGPSFSDSRFHNIASAGNDPGRAKITKVATDRGAYKTPTLRNIALTGPYFHDGSKKTLRETIDHYELVTRPEEKVKHPNLDELMLPIKLSDAEKDQLIAFLHTLTGDKRDPAIFVVPELPQ